MTFTIIGAYLLGVALHVAWKWTGWINKNRKASLWAYWREYLGLNVQASITAVVALFMWEQGWLQAIINNVMGGMFGQEFTPLETTFWSSVAAGYIQDSMARTALMMFAKKDKE